MTHDDELERMHRDVLDTFGRAVTLRAPETVVTRNRINQTRTITPGDAYTVTAEPEPTTRQPAAVGADAGAKAELARYGVRAGDLTGENEPAANVGRGWTLIDSADGLERHVTDVTRDPDRNYLYIDTTRTV